jgi:nitrate reductase NapE component
MLWPRLKSALARFRDDCRGQIMVETVIMFPLLVWALAGGYEFFEVYRFQSVREKATYTVADMFSRELSSVNATYMDNTKVLFDEITNDDASNQIRVSVIKYDADSDEYSVKWSAVRGTGPYEALRDNDVARAHDSLPIMGDGEEVILVESRSTYDPVFSVGLSDDTVVSTRQFTAIRFAPQLCWEDCA